MVLLCRAINILSWLQGLLSQAKIELQKTKYTASVHRSSLLNTVRIKTECIMFYAIEKKLNFYPAPLPWEIILTNFTNRAR